MRSKMMREKKSVLFFNLAVLTLLFTLCFGISALADETGWVQSGKKIYYYQASEETGEIEKVADQMLQIGKKTYAFNEAGELITGWAVMEDGYRYFKKTGTLGTVGAMYTGYKVIDKGKYFFSEQGLAQTGLISLPKYTYYFNKTNKIGEYGKAITGKWKTVDGVKYYFQTNARMAKNCWVKKLWYMDENGVMLKNTVTPDGYLVGKDGKKVGTKKVSGWVKISGKYHYYDTASKKLLASCWKTINGSKYYLNNKGSRVTGWQTIGKYKYYFSSKGVMQKGWQTISGKQYYFGTNGRMQKNKKVDNFILDENGVAAKDPDAKTSILVIAGHGQGDAGATSTWGYESVKNREFASLICSQLKTKEGISVTYYKNGSQSYDCYQQNARTFGSSGMNMSSSITGSGAVKSSVLSGLRSNPNLPDFTEYDYVLEIHFNATGYDSKDPGGNGSFKGCGFYINSRKSKYILEKNIISRMAGTGFKAWGCGVYASSTLFNARICQELGVSYGLLETAFIDDGDDMRFYNSHKTQLAAAVADSIAAYYR